MNAERAHEATEKVLREYVKSRSSTRKDSKGDTWSSGMTIVSPDDKRIGEIARLVVEAIMNLDDQRPRLQVEARALRLGDVFTRYMIKDGIAVDEEVAVVKVTTAGGVTTVRYRRPNDSIVDAPIDATFLVSVVRPTADDLKSMLEEA